MQGVGKGKWCLTLGEELQSMGVRSAKEGLSPLAHGENLSPERGRL